eukprot:228442_1
MKVKVNTTSPESNYIIIIGDLGANYSSTSDVKVQTAIAEKMKTFYQNQKAKGMNLLFVGTVGDNFYYDGQTCAYYTKRWTEMYVVIATVYPWLAVMGIFSYIITILKTFTYTYTYISYDITGNHDWGTDDPHAICSWGAKDIKYTDQNTGIPYTVNHINADK